MGVIFHIMQEEYERLQAVIDSYQAAIAKEAKGAPRLKQIGLKYYLYLEKRVGPKVIHEYIGDMESDKAIKVHQSVKKRKEYQALLRKAKADFKDVKKVLRGKI